jgi:hypothetical protein
VGHVGSFTVICPQCQQLGERSKVYEGGTVTTAMGFSRFWDEDGVKHIHDPNTTTKGYRCSRGHGWNEVSLADCPAKGCDFGA